LPSAALLFSTSSASTDGYASTDRYGGLSWCGLSWCTDRYAAWADAQTGMADWADAMCVKWITVSGFVAGRMRRSHTRAHTRAHTHIQTHTHTQIVIECGGWSVGNCFVMFAAVFLCVGSCWNASRHRQVGRPGMVTLLDWACDQNV
jgi:hypothetical protein